MAVQCVAGMQRTRVSSFQGGPARGGLATPSTDPRVVMVHAAGAMHRHAGPADGDGRAGGKRRMA